MPMGGTFVSRACTFVVAGRGYQVRTIVSESQAAREGPLLERIIQATEFGPKETSL
jgi:hypothetical protein